MASKDKKILWWLKESNLILITFDSISHKKHKWNTVRKLKSNLNECSTFDDRFSGFRFARWTQGEFRQCFGFTKLFSIVWILQIYAFILTWIRDIRTFKNPEFIKIKSFRTDYGLNSQFKNACRASNHTALVVDF